MWRWHWRWSRRWRTLRWWRSGRWRLRGGGGPFVAVAAVGSRLRRWWVAVVSHGGERRWSARWRRTRLAPSSSARHRQQIARKIGPLRGIRGGFNASRGGRAYRRGGGPGIRCLANRPLGGLWTPYLVCRWHRRQSGWSWSKAKWRWRNRRRRNFDVLRGQTQQRQRRRPGDLRDPRDAGGCGRGGSPAASTGVTWTDPVEAAALRDASAAHKIENVMLVLAFLAAAALAHAVKQPNRLCPNRAVVHRTRHRHAASSSSGRSCRSMSAIDPSAVSTTASVAVSGSMNNSAVWA